MTPGDLETLDPAGGIALSSGYMGAVRLVEHDGQRYAVKTASHTGGLRVVSRWLLRREYRAYQRMADIAGTPRCYGLLDGQHLVLEYIDSGTLRDTTPEDWDYFFARYFEILAGIHERGVAHRDLKRKENVLVVAGRVPCLVDFGTAKLKKGGWHLINDYLYRLGCHIDRNAWVKQKYNRDYSAISEADQPYFRRTLLERGAKRLRRRVKRVIRRLIAAARS